MRDEWIVLLMGGVEGNAGRDQRSYTVRRCRRNGTGIKPGPINKAIQFSTNQGVRAWMHWKSLFTTCALLTMSWSSNAPSPCTSKDSAI